MSEFRDYDSWKLRAPEDEYVQKGEDCVHWCAHNGCNKMLFDHPAADRDEWGTFRVACPEPELPGDIYCLECTRKFDRAIGAIVIAAQLSLGLTDEEVDFFPFKLDYQSAK